jgi:hypothetical protein
MSIPGRVQALDAGTSRVNFGSDSLDRIAQDLVALGPDIVRVDAPPEVLAHLHTVGRRLQAAAHG